MLTKPHVFVVGGLYEDRAYHPCLCIGIDEEERDLTGISLIDGSIPRSCSIDHCGPEPITIEDAVLIRLNFETFKQRRMGGSSLGDAVRDLTRRDVS